MTNYDISAECDRHVYRFVSETLGVISAANADELEAWLTWAEYVIVNRVNVSAFVRGLDEFDALPMAAASYGKRTSEAVQIIKRLGNGTALDALVAIEELNADRIDDGLRPFVSVQTIAREWAPTAKPRKAPETPADVPSEGNGVDDASDAAKDVTADKRSVTDVILANLANVTTMDELEIIMLAVGARMDAVGSAVKVAA
jgi:hypothetical protein